MSLKLNFKSDCANSKKSGDKITMERLGQQLKTISESVTTTFPQFYSHFNI